MKEFNLFKTRIWMIILIIIFASISAGLLTSVNTLTKNRIALNEEVKLKKGVLNVFGIPYERIRIIDIFDEKIEIGQIENKTIYRYFDRGRLFGIAFQIKGSGFWGPIYAMVAMDPNLENIKGIEILHQEETPGLGGRIIESEFKDQFKGKPVEPEITVDAITGATMTTNAFKKIINENVRLFREKFKNR